MTIRPEEYGYKTVHTGNRSHKPSSEKMRWLAKKWGEEHGYYGDIGGWIYNKNGQHIAHGWGQFFYVYGYTIREWATEKGLMTENEAL